MAKTKTVKKDDVESLLQTLGIIPGKTGRRQGNMTVEPRTVKLTQIDLSSFAVQFRLKTAEATVERMLATLEADGTLPRPLLVEAALLTDVNGVRSVRQWQEGEDDLKGYLCGDGVHRLETYQRLGRESVEATIVRHARNPLDVAKELSIRININPQTGVNDAEREIGLYRMHDLHREMSHRELGKIVGLSHVHVGRLLTQRRVRQVLERAGTQVPANKSLLEELANVTERDMPDVAKVALRERWSSVDLHDAREREKAITDADWSDLKDWRHQPAMVALDWRQAGEVNRLRLAHQANRNGWTDEQLVWAARYHARLRNSQDKDERDEYRLLMQGDLHPDSWMAESEGWEEPAPAPRTPQPVPPTPEPWQTPVPPPPPSRGGTVLEPPAPHPGVVLEPPAPPTGVVLEPPTPPEGVPLEPPAAESGTQVPEPDTPQPAPANGGTEEPKAAEPTVLVALRTCRQRHGQIEGSLAALEALGDELAQRASAEQTQRLQVWATELWELASDLRALAATLATARV